LKRIKKGTSRQQQIEAGQWVRQAGIELSEYVVLGIGGKKHSKSHALETAKALNAINPDFIRLRTFVPKINTPLLQEVQAGSFQMLGPLEVLTETELIVRNLAVTSYLASDHYTNYINVEGKLPERQNEILNQIQTALARDASTFRPFFVGNE
jgi:radical SAM superfamily enzyme